MSELTETTDVAIRVFETTPAVVGFNYDEISNHLDGVLEKYKGLVFSDKDVAECKKTIAELRKGQKSLDEFRKATKKQLTESVTAFESQCKVLYKKFETVIEPLTAQQAQFETDRKELKRGEIQSFIDALVADHLLADKYAVQLVILDEYLAKGKTIKSIKAELLALANTLSVQEEKEAQDIELIKMKVQLANAEYQLKNALWPDTYLRYLPLYSIANIEEMITNDATQQRDLEEEANDAAEALESAKAAEVPEVVEHYAPEMVETPSAGDSETPFPVSEELDTKIYMVTGTQWQLCELEAYLAANKLNWTESYNDEDEDDDSFLD